MADKFNLDAVDHSWREILSNCLSKMEPPYLERLHKFSANSNGRQLPGKNKIFNAFSLPLVQVKRVLFGESPYPREISANGYAFWDNAVSDIFSEKNSPENLKLSKSVNRAASLRNFIKMLAGCHKKNDFNIPAPYIQTLAELFQNLLNHGFLLLNASLVYHDKKQVKNDAKMWEPFLACLLEKIYRHNPRTELIFLGKIAQRIDRLIQQPYKKIYAEHPYNLSFIHNPVVIDYFKPFNLLQRSG